MAFTFPTDKADFTAPNGITYSWDATDEKWVVKTYKADESALEDYVLADDFVADQDRQDARIDELTAEVIARGTYELVNGFDNVDGKLHVDGATWGGVTFFQFGLKDADGNDTPTMKVDDVFRVADPTGPTRNEFKITIATHPNYRVQPLSNIGSVGSGFPAVVSFIGQPSRSLNERVTDGEAKQATIETTINTALDVQNDIQAEQVVQNDDITQLQNKVSALEGSIIDAVWTFEQDDRPPRAGEFALRAAGSAVTADFSAATSIIINTTDFNGETYTFDKVTVNDVIRIGAADGSGAEYRVTLIIDAGWYTVDHLRSTPDVADEQEYAFTFLSAFDPQGLATIDYVDAQDDLDLKLTGGTLTGRLYFDRGAGGHNMVLSPNASDTSSSIYALNSGALRFRTSLTDSLSTGTNTHIAIGRTDDENQAPVTYLYHIPYPDQPNWAVPRSYVDDAVEDAVGDIDLSDYLPLTGGTLTGATRITGAGLFIDSSAGNESVRIEASGFMRTFDMMRVQRTSAGPAFQARINSEANAEISTDGSAYFKGDIAMNGNKITGLADPTADAQAATKRYVDDNAGGGVVVHDGSTPPNTADRGTLLLTTSNQLYVYVGP